MGADLLLPPLSRWLVSDGSAPVHPAVLDALAAANAGHARSYGGDGWTAAAQEEFTTLFGGASRSFLTVNGTGSNVLGLAAMLRPGEAIVSAARAHINVDEAGAPERLLGAKIIGLESPDGKLVVEQLDDLERLRGVPHHAQPGVLSLTQCTEFGTLYQPDELTALCRRAHEMGLRVHLDGARLANAVAALGGDRATLRALTVDAGIDVLTFGGTKNGLMAAEAVVFIDGDLAERAPFLRKQVTQLVPKMRYLAAQFLAILEADLWIELADHANAMARLLWEQTKDLVGVTYDVAPVVNSVFPCLDAAMIEPLRAWCPFLDWDVPRRQVRWMTSWDTTADDISLVAHGLGELASRLCGTGPT